MTFTVYYERPLPAMEIIEAADFSEANDKAAERLLRAGVLDDDLPDAYWIEAAQ